MSTKCTVAHGEGFHLYEEQMDHLLDGETNTIRLELDNVDFEVYPNNITVSIPLDVWEYIRLFSLQGYKFADMTDDELYEQAKNGAKTRLKWSSEYNSLDECVEGTFENYKKRREQQINMREKLQRQLGKKPETNPYYRGSK